MRPSFVVAGGLIFTGVLGGIVALASRASAAVAPATKPKAKATTPHAAAPHAAAPHAAAPHAAAPSVADGKVALTKGTAYRASLTLDGMEALATNDMLAEQLQSKAGPWSGLTVTGSGGSRSATGTYAGESRRVALPSQVTDFHALGAPAKAPAKAAPGKHAAAAAPKSQAASIPVHPVEVTKPATPAAAHASATRLIPAAPHGKPAAHAAAPHAAAPAPAPTPTAAAPSTAIVPVPRTARQAAQDLYDYVTARIRAGHGSASDLGSTGNRNEIVRKAQEDMRGAKLLAALARGEGGVYGPLSMARGKELLGREFPRHT